MGQYANPCADRRQLRCHVETLVDHALKKITNGRTDVPGRRSIQMYRPDDLERYAALWDKNRSDGSQNSLAVLQDLKKWSPNWTCTEPPSDESLLALRHDFPNFEDAVDCVRRAAALGRLAPAAPVHLPPLLLDGPPGVGKSTFAQQLAKALGVELIQFSMAQATASFSLGGLDGQYASGGPGYLVRAIAEIGQPDAVVFIDELDKASTQGAYDPAGPLYSLMEPSTARAFVDEGLRMPLNLSALRWICTSNDVAHIPLPLQSRCVHISIRPPTKEEMMRIADGIYMHLLDTLGVKEHFDSEMRKDVREALAAAVPRDLAKSLRDALGAAALNGRGFIELCDITLSKRSQGIGFLK